MQDWLIWNLLWDDIHIYLCKILSKGSDARVVLPGCLGPNSASERELYDEVIDIFRRKTPSHLLLPPLMKDDIVLKKKVTGVASMSCRRVFEMITNVSTTRFTESMSTTRKTYVRGIVLRYTRYQVLYLVIIYVRTWCKFVASTNKKTQTRLCMLRGGKKRFLHHPRPLRDS